MFDFIEKDSYTIVAFYYIYSLQIFFLKKYKYNIISSKKKVLVMVQKHCGGSIPPLKHPQKKFNLL